MYTVRIYSQLEDRLDAEFYNPEALKTVQKIDELGKTKRLGQLIAEGYRVVYHGTDSINGITEDKLLPFLSPTQIDDQGGIDFTSVDKLPIYYKDDYPKGLAVAGELLIEVKGNVSKVGVVPEIFPKHLMVSGSLYKASFKDDTNSRYVLAFLKSKPGQLLKNRLTSNTIINYIAKGALYSIPLFVAEADVQKYIGDKVRQAERLRAWGRRSYQESVDLFQDAVANYGYLPKPSNNFAWTKLGNRLDPAYYDPKYSFLDETWFLTNSLPLREFIAEGAYGVLPDSSSYGFGDQRFIRATDIRKSNIDATAFTLVPSDQVAAKAKIKTGDILLEIKGAIEACELAGAHLSGAYVNGSIYRFSPKNIKAGYLAFYLRSFIKQLYCERVSVNNIIAYLDLGSISALPVLRLTDELEDGIEQAFLSHLESTRYAFALTKAAKLLVEALIEGQLTEAELIAAEQALQAGNDQLDRRILHRLKADGIDGQGPALFSDLDELYRLLAQAEADE
ncbi:MAG: hypothetical protein ACKN9W_08630 [Methylococcus sp.]